MMNRSIISDQSYENAFAEEPVFRRRKETEMPEFRK